MRLVSGKPQCPLQNRNKTKQKSKQTNKNQLYFAFSNRIIMGDDSYLDKYKIIN